MIEFIESYLKIGKGDYQWCANHGELIRCSDCAHWIPGVIDGKDNFHPPRCRRNDGSWSADDFCSNAEKKATRSDA